MLTLNHSYMANLTIFDLFWLIVKFLLALGLVGLVCVFVYWLLHTIADIFTGKASIYVYACFGTIAVIVWLIVVVQYGGFSAK
jgi:hypothetical protein